MENQVTNTTATILKRSAVITGSAGDLGRSLCEAFLKDGYLVYAADIRPQDAADGLVPVSIDVSDRGAVFALAERVARESHPQIWINGAGVFITTSITAATESDWDRIIDINLKGTFNGCAAALQILGAAGGGRIINVGSISGQVGGGGVHPAYAASKAGVHVLTKIYALEGARKNVLCNAVAPGLLEGSMIQQFTSDQLDRVNRMNPLKRAGTMMEVTEVVRFLAGPGATYMTGATLPVNGGALMP
jgi:3-oxoacyl-[acyl-carrier protein] reductase